MSRRGVSQKRALSPMVATVLLILLVLILFFLIYLWYQGFISERVEKFGQPIEQQCSQVNFVVASVESRGSSKYELEILNRGNIDIYRLEIIMKKEGESQARDFEFSIPAGASTKGEVSLVMEELGIPDSVFAYPVLIGSAQGKDSNRAITCIDNGRVIEL